MTILTWTEQQNGQKDETANAGYDQQGDQDSFPIARLGHTDSHLLKGTMNTDWLKKQWLY